MTTINISNNGKAMASYVSNNNVWRNENGNDNENDMCMCSNVCANGVIINGMQTFPSVSSLNNAGNNGVIVTG